MQSAIVCSIRKAKGGHTPKVLPPRNKITPCLLLRTLMFLVLSARQVATAQDRLAILEDPQVDLHLLHSCLENCKIVHLLYTVPFNVLLSFFEEFDDNLRNCLSHILLCNLPDNSWYLTTLLFGLGCFIILLWQHF